ncbi:MAG: hypothetical protein WCE38_03830 [Burkholderiales bacterium]
MHHREDHRRRPRSEGERQQRDGGKTGPTAKGAQRVAHVLPQVVDPAGPARVPALLLDLLGPAKFEPRLSSRIVRRDTARDEVGSVSIEMEAQFAVELIFQLGAADETTPPGHSAPPSDSFRIAPIAPANRCQFSVSLPSAARPLRVRR